MERNKVKCSQLKLFYCGTAPAMTRTPALGRRYFLAAALTWSAVTAL